MADDRQPVRSRQSDIARAAGVSQATVSMVLNGRTGKGAAISASTRDRVLRAAAELGYAANPAARSLAGGRNQLLGVFTLESVFPAETADFYHPFLVGVEREAEAQGYDLILFTSTAGSDGRRRIYRDNANRLRMADGCVLLGDHEDRTELDRLAGEDFPFVFIGRRELPGRQISYVGAEYVDGTAEAVALLARRGHRRVAYLGTGVDREPILDREAGYRRAQERFGLDADPRLRLTTSGSHLRWEQVRDLLESGVTAFVTEDDPLLLRLLALTEEAGLRVPQDLSVVTLVDPTRAELADVSGLRVPRHEMGATAVRLLVDLLAGAARLRQVVLPCTVVAGTTVGPAPSRPEEHSS